MYLLAFLVNPSVSEFGVSRSWSRMHNISILNSLNLRGWSWCIMNIIYLFINFNVSPIVGDFSPRKPRNSRRTRSRARAMTSFLSLFCRYIEPDAIDLTCRCVNNGDNNNTRAIIISSFRSAPQEEGSHPFRSLGAPGSNRRVTSSSDSSGWWLMLRARAQRTFPIMKQ